MVTKVVYFYNIFNASVAGLMRPQVKPPDQLYADQLTAKGDQQGRMEQILQFVKGNLLYFNS